MNERLPSGENNPGTPAAAAWPGLDQIYQGLPGTDPGDGSGPAAWTMADPARYGPPGTLQARSWPSPHQDAQSYITEPAKPAERHTEPEPEISPEEAARRARHAARFKPAIVHPTVYPKQAPAVVEPDIEPALVAPKQPRERVPQVHEFVTVSDPGERSARTRESRVKPAQEKAHRWWMKERKAGRNPTSTQLAEKYRVGRSTAGRWLADFTRDT